MIYSRAGVGNDVGEGYPLDFGPPLKVAFRDVPWWCGGPLTMRIFIA